MQIEQMIGLAAGVLTGISMLPQLVKLIRHKDGKALSPVMLIILTAGLGLWVYYGFLRNDLPIIITNAFSFCVNTSLLVLRQVYRKRG